MNERKWKDLSEADRAAIETTAGSAFAARMSAMDRANLSSAQKLVEGGVKVVDASPEFTAELKKAWAFLEEDWIREAGKRGVDGAAALRFYREQLAGSGTARR
jgi:TRAP-type C4-dicarboxylate transport system substrate-binding protein